MNSTPGTGLDNPLLRALVAERIATRKLYSRYKKLYDHDKPFGPENQGVYRWQIDFHNAGREHTERGLLAANRIGKTETAAAEIACHMTGWYPDWWEGKRFTKPTKGWTGCETNELSRDVVQNKLLGSVLKGTAEGTGWVPKEALGEVRFRQAGVSDVVDTFYVRHVSGGWSQCTLKTYEAGRRKWQGTSRDWIWLDEEAPGDIYTEALTRILDSHGVLLQTFTPLLGATDVVEHFTGKDRPKTVYFQNVTWNDAPHLDEDAKAAILSSYPEWEREARSMGVPMLGSGLVFNIRDSDISVPGFKVPDHWGRINGTDFGIDHPAAGVSLAHDRESDTIYVVDCYKQSNQTPVYHAEWFKKTGQWIPVAWPKDGLARDKGSGITLRDQYRSHGVKMLKDFAQYRDERAVSVEAGIVEMLEYMRSGRFKVFDHLTQWFEEKRFYHRKDGVVQPTKDDILSATRYAFVMRRKAVTRAEGVGSIAPTRKYRGPVYGGTP